MVKVLLTNDRGSVVGELPEVRSTEPNQPTIEQLRAQLAQLEAQEKEARDKEIETLEARLRELKHTPTPTGKGMYRAKSGDSLAIETAVGKCGARFTLADVLSHMTDVVMVGKQTKEARTKAHLKAVAKDYTNYVCVGVDTYQKS